MTQTSHNPADDSIAIAVGGMMWALWSCDLDEAQGHIRRALRELTGQGVTTGHPALDSLLERLPDISDLTTRIASREADFASSLRRVRSLNGEVARLRDQLARALPFVEEAESDPAYRAGAVRALSTSIRAEISDGEVGNG